MDTVAAVPVISLCAPDAIQQLAQAVGSAKTQTLILEPPADNWRQILATAIERGALQIPRVALAGKSIDQIAHWLEHNIPQGDVSADVRNALISDLLYWLHLQSQLTGADYFHFRLLAEPPCQQCGFHLDTHAPGLSTWGMVHVYNGAGTLWVDTADVISMTSFYRWLHLRDKVIRTHPSGTPEQIQQLQTFDEQLSFLKSGATIHQMPVGVSVLFRHLDASLHWSEHAPELAWIHCSPMRGARRLVVNICAAYPATH